MKYAILFILVTSAVYGVTAEYTETRTAEPGTILEVYNQNGSVYVAGWKGDKVEVEITKKTSKDAAELEKVTCEISTGAKMVVKTKYSEEKTSVSVTYRIKVPAHVRVGMLKTANGDIDISGVSGDIVLNTANGDIKALEVDRLAEAVTSNGSVKADLVAIPEGGVIITTANGSISVHLNKEIDCEIVASTVNGRVSVEGIDISDKSKSRTLMTGKIGDGGPKVKVVTVNGSVTISEIK